MSPGLDCSVSGYSFSQETVSLPLRESKEARIALSASVNKRLSHCSDTRCARSSSHSYTLHFINTGDTVLIHKDTSRANYPKDKLANLYVGPFTILRRYGDHAYFLSLPPGMNIDPVMNIRNLKRYPVRDIGEEKGESPPNLPTLGEIYNHLRNEDSK